MEFTNFGKTGGAGGERKDGIGMYALSKDVHWTAENKKEELEDPTTMSRILNRFGPHWDQNKKFGNEGLKKAKVWVEKSPQNAVLSTFLEGLYNMPVREDGTVDLDSSMNNPKRSATKFIYVTRHPIANVYATEKFVRDAMGGHIDFEILLQNYIALHKYMKMDEKALKSPVMWVHLEDFTSEPTEVLTRVFRFLNVAADGEVVQHVLQNMPEIKTGTNTKYLMKWCEEGTTKYGNLIDKYADELNALELGYDLDNIC